MKRNLKCIVFLLSVFVSLNVVAAETGYDKKEIKKFLKVLKKVDDKHVEYIKIDADSVVNDLLNQFDKLGYGKQAAKKIDITNVVSVSSKDEDGYANLRKIVEDYELGECDEFAGMPLMANERSRDTVSVMYCSDNATLIINEIIDEKIDINFMDFNIMNLANILMDALMGAEEDLDVEGVDDFSSWVSLGGIKMIFSGKGDFDDDEDDNEGLSNIDMPMLKEINGEWRIVTSKSYVVTSKEELKEPHRNTTELWLNSLNFAEYMTSDNQAGWLLTPESFLALYCHEFIGMVPVELEYPSIEYRAAYENEVDGGAPYAIGRYAVDAEGRKEILADVGFLFDGDSDFFGMKKTASYKNDRGQHYCQYYSEKSILYLYDDPVNEKCIAVALVNSTGLIKSYINQCKINGEGNIAENVNFVINRFGLTVQKEPFTINGETHKSGVWLNINEINEFYDNYVNKR